MLRGKSSEATCQSELKNESLFKTVHVVIYSLEWNNGMDFCPEVLYSGSSVMKQDNQKD